MPQGLHGKADTEAAPVGLEPALIHLLSVYVQMGCPDTATLAERLCYSEHTVKTYFKRINEVLGTHSRIQAVLLAQHHGLIQPVEKVQDSPLPA